MSRRWALAAASVTLMASLMTVHGDWKSHIAKRVVGEIAQEGLEEVFEDAAKDAAFAALGAVVDDGLRPTYEAADVRQREAIGATASTAVEAAMTAADVADSIDDVLDAADTVKKINKIQKVIRKIR